MAKASKNTARERVKYFSERVNSMEKFKRSNANWSKSDEAELKRLKKKLAEWKKKA